MITKQELKDKNTKLTLANKELRQEQLLLNEDIKEKDFKIKDLEIDVRVYKEEVAKVVEQLKDKDTTISLQAQEIALLKNQLALAKEDRTRAMDEVKSFKQALAIVAAAGK